MCKNEIQSGLLLDTQLALRYNIIDLIDKQNNPTIATYAKDGIVTIRVTAHDEDGKSATQLIDNTCGNICDILGDNVYSLEDEELECVPQAEEQGPRSRQVGQGCRK